LKNKEFLDITFSNLYVKLLNVYQFPFCEELKTYNISKTYQKFHRGGVALIGLSLASAQSAQALSFFTDRANWEAAVQARGQTVVNEDFQSFPTDVNVDLFTTTTGVTIDCAVTTPGTASCASSNIQKRVQAFPDVANFNGFDGQFLGSAAIDGNTFGLPNLGATGEVVTLPTGNQAFAVNVAK
jgi:hypothetical protein